MKKGAVREKGDSKKGDSPPPPLPFFLVHNFNKANSMRSVQNILSTKSKISLKNNIYSDIIYNKFLLNSFF